jgi:hypothetical protein
MAEHELTVTHRGTEYLVILDGDSVYVDDSFDHEFGTERCGHWELDWESTDIVAVVDSDGDEIDPETIPGLIRAIRQASDDLEITD